MATFIAAFPIAISLVKGLEKRHLWKPAPAQIEEVGNGRIRYVYAAHGKVFRKEQDLPSQSSARGGGNYMPGDRIFVHVHTRNEALSILDPPIFQRIWRDFGRLDDPYKGQLVKM